MASTYEIYALNQAGRTVDWSSRLYSHPPGKTTRSAYFLWVLHGPAGPIVVDTGFVPHQAEVQGVTLDGLRTREELLAAAGVDPAQRWRTVILTHLHWDHFDVEEMFPRATFWVQRLELDFWTRYGARERLAPPGSLPTASPRRRRAAVIRASARRRRLRGRDRWGRARLGGGHNLDCVDRGRAHRARCVRAGQRRADDVPEPPRLAAAGLAPQQRR